MANYKQNEMLLPSLRDEGGDKAHSKYSFMRAPGKEDISRREEFVKHFELGGNRRQAIVYGHPVHYRNGNGDWEDIDNTLEEAVTAHGRKVLRNKSNHVHMEFPQEMDGGNMASISCDGKTFAWRFEQEAQMSKSHRRTGEEMKQQRLVQKAKGMAKYVGRTDESLRSANLAAEMQSEQEQRMEIAKLHAENRYDEVLPGVSVRYELSGNALKEDIILSEQEALSRAAIRLPDTFNYEATAHQELHVLDKENGDLLFAMNTPLVYDAEGKKVEGSIRLTPCSGYTRMEYVIDADFMVNAVWPVTIDPTVRYAKSRTNIEDAGLYRTEAPNTPHPNKEDYNCGNRGAYEYITLVKFNKLVKQKSSDTVVAALVGMHPTESLDVEEHMACYPMKKDWDATTATWNNIYPDTDEYISEDVISYVDTTGTTCYFDITNLYRSWYQKEKNFGVAFRYPLGVNGEKHFVKWAGAARNSENGPCMIVNYMSHAGLESWWQYESMDAGGVGSAHVDLFNGNMVFEHVDVAMSGNRMPVSVTHYYNSCLALTNEQGCGMGWRLSVNQSLYKVSLTNASWTKTTYYVWTDGDGTEHYFPASGSEPYKDEETKTLELTISGSTATITSKDDTKMKFPLPSGATKKYITSIADACGNKMTYAYIDNADLPTNGYIEKITDAAGRETIFSYDEDGMLIGILSPDQQSVSFDYDENNQLIEINHPNMGVLNLSYTNGLLANASNVDGSLGGVGVQIGYQNLDDFDENSESDIESCRVTSLMQTGIEDRGSMMCFDYLTSMTKVKVLESGDEMNPIGKTLSYQFNANGNLVCVFDELGYGKRTDFDNYNTPENSSRMQKAVINLVRDIAFANEGTDWIRVNEDNEGAISQDTSSRCLSMPSLKIAKTKEGSSTVSQTAQVYSSGKYTFSAYIKAENLEGDAYLRITSGSNTQESMHVQNSTEDADCGPAAEGWERVRVTADVAVGEGETNVTLELVCNASSGTAYFACPQLEVGEIANRVNLLNNADFARTEVNNDNAETARQFPVDWLKRDGITSNVLNGVIDEDHDMPPFLSGKALRMVSFPARDSVAFNQTIPVKGSKNDVFVIGGWLNSQSVSSGSDHSAPCIAYRFTNGTTNGDWKYAEFSREWVGWQFGAWAIAAPTAYTSITFSVNYARNAQTAMFTNMFLYREQFGQSFAYDSKKNLTSVENLAGQKSKMKYDSFDNLTSYVQPGANEEDTYSFTYGSEDADKKKHLVNSSSTPLKVKQQFEYDDYGNLTLSKTVNGTENVIGSKTKYDYSGNYEVKSYDGRGNAVSRSINPVDFTLTNVTDPDGQKVSYEYDDAKRVVGVQAQADDKTYRNAYTYENNRLKTVAHNTDGNDCDVVYRFEYDGLGRKTSVKVCNGEENCVEQELSTNHYSNDRSGLLEKATYGNGGEVNYVYDKFDRLEKVYYEDGNEDQPRYSYVYDASGEVGKVHDHHLNRTLETERDLAFRPRQSTLKDGDGNVIYRTTLYYDKMNHLTKFAEKAAGAAHTSEYTYDKDNRTTEIKYDYVKPETESSEPEVYDKVAYTYDKLGRIEQRVASVGNNNYTTSYEFVEGATDLYVDRTKEGYENTVATTPLVSKITQNSGEGSNNTMDFEYSYDNRGNITDVVHTGDRTVQTTHYDYDALGQLVRVDDKTEFREGVVPEENEGLSESSTWVYEYDCGGNITSKKKYPYTTEKNPGTAVEYVPYLYGDANWKDKLTAYNGQAITYDSIGNPLFDGERTYTWGAGRQLKHVSMPADRDIEAEKAKVQGRINIASETVLQLVREGNTLKAHVFRSGREITDEREARAFTWSRNSGNEAEDTAWDNAHAGMKQITLTDDEINGNVEFSCTFAETEGIYEVVRLGENLEIIQEFETNERNYEFSLEDGMLKVQPKASAINPVDYKMVNGTLFVNSGFSGTLTSSVTFNKDAKTLEIDFSYDHNGMRTQKKVVDNLNNTTTTYDYTLHGKLITHLTKRVVNAEGVETSKDELHFFYDDQARPAFVEHGDIKYRYVHNLQGDIVAIVDAAGNPVVKYECDAWGGFVGNVSKNEIGNLNPFRYRGYVWDTETNLYYLKERYYCSRIGRFINLDDEKNLSLYQDSMSSAECISINLNAYCANNPIVRIDEAGAFWESLKKGLKKAAIGAAIVAGIALISIPTGGAAALALASGYAAAMGVAAAKTIAVAAGSASSLLYLASNASEKYSGKSTYNKNRIRIDYEYYGNRNGGIHLEYKGTKIRLWDMRNGVGAIRNIPKTVQRIISKEEINRAIQKAIYELITLAGDK